MATLAIGPGGPGRRPIRNPELGIVPTCVKMIPMKKWLPASALLAASALTACGSGSGSDDVSSDYIASMYPAAFLLERVTGDEVGVLTPAGADPHDLELTPRQTGRVHDASLIVTIGAMQPAVDDVVADLDSDRVLDLRETVDLRANDADDDHGHDHGDDDAEGESHDHGHSHDEDDDHGHGHSHDEDDDHADDHGHGTDDAHEDEDHDHGPEDPHFWTDPTLMAQATEAIVDQLSEIEPDRAEEFRANGDALIADLQDLDQAFADGLATCERRTFVTSHQAFGYLADRYDLDEVAIAGINTSDEASPAAVARVVDEIRDSGVTTVFAERLTGVDTARTVADEADVQVAVLDPIEGLTDETADRDYVSLMKENLEALRAAGDCT